MAPALGLPQPLVGDLGSGLGFGLAGYALAYWTGVNLSTAVALFRFASVLFADASQLAQLRAFKVLLWEVTCLLFLASAAHAAKWRLRRWRKWSEARLQLLVGGGLLC